MRRRRWIGVLAALCAIPLLSELAYGLAALAARDPGRTGSCAVLVLGYPARDDGTPHPVQTLRVGAGVEAMRRHDCDKIVVSGGAVANRFAEADTMAEIAAGLGVARERIVLERRATSTWENVAFSLPLMEGEETLYLVSDGLHARRGRRTLCRQRPDLCDRAVVVAAYRPFELLWWKVPASLYELALRLRDR